MHGTAVRACPASILQLQVCIDLSANRAAFAARIPSVGSEQVLPAPLEFVFEHAKEHADADISQRSGQMTVAEYSFQIKLSQTFELTLHQS